MEIAKALILAGRTAHDQPWPSVRTGPKHLVPVANQPILFHNLESLRRAGLIEATIALDQDAAPIRDAVGDGSKWGLTVRYVDWQPGSGVDGALAAAREFVAQEPLLVEPGDILHRELIHPHIAAFAREALDALALRVLPVTGAADGKAMVGGYLFSPRAVAMLLEGPAAGDPFVGVQSQGGHVRAETIDGCLPCHGGQDQLLEGNRRMLEQLKTDIAPELPASCEIQGRVLDPPHRRARSHADPRPGDHRRPDAALPRLRRAVLVDRRGRRTSRDRRSSTRSCWTAPSSSTWERGWTRA